MTYQEFNKKVFELYALRASTSFCTLSLDRKEVERILPVSELRSFSLLRHSWEGLLATRNGLPLYFGLIGIQCYAASLMQKDDQNAEDAYQVRLCETLGLDDNYTLQALFRGADKHNPIQEEIWFSAKDYLLKALNLDLEIPERTKYAWRYVRYPISQALLNTEDLKHFTILFAQEFKVKEDLPFAYFKNCLEASLSNIKLTRRAIDLLNEFTKREKCLRQVYDFYNIWEGEVYYKPSEKRALGKPLPKKLTSDRTTLLLTFKEEQPCFYVFDIEDSKVLREVGANEIFALNDFSPVHDGLIFFNELEYYPNEYESARFLYPESVCYILLNKYTRPAEYRFLECNSLTARAIGRDTFLFKCQFINKKASILSRFFQVKNPVQLVGGLKINRRKEYLKGFGPSIKCDVNHWVIKGHYQCHYHPQQAESGVYKVRVSNFKDVEFAIVDNRELCGQVPSKGKGWNLLAYHASSDYHLEGCLVNGNFQSLQDDIRLWINAHLKRKGEEKYTGSNLLIRTITNAAI